MAPATAMAHVGRGCQPWAVATPAVRELPSPQLQTVTAPATVPQCRHRVVTPTNATARAHRASRPAGPIPIAFRLSFAERSTTVAAISCRLDRRAAPEPTAAPAIVSIPHVAELLRAMTVSRARRIAAPRTTARASTPYWLTTV